ncbi:hypothetical protein [Rhizobium leguminosarum]|uniref:hypothetical protein n=1 Tax=Rhizobium leguminosarum TaxID=384 RepID=UPI0012BC82E3|nr:hypothetical protein [Rhizobium leguminosarum]
MPENALFFMASKIISCRFSKIVDNYGVSSPAAEECMCPAARAGRGSLDAIVN